MTVGGRIGVGVGGVRGVGMEGGRGKTVGGTAEDRRREIEEDGGGQAVADGPGSRFMMESTACWHCRTWALTCWRSK